MIGAAIILLLLWWGGKKRGQSGAHPAPGTSAGQKRTPIENGLATSPEKAEKGVQTETSDTVLWRAVYVGDNGDVTTDRHRSELRIDLVTGHVTRSENIVRCTSNYLLGKVQ